MFDPIRATAAETAAAIRARQVSPVEVMQATLDRAERSQPVLNAFVTLCPDRALAEARAAEAAVMRGGDLPPLHGVPLSVKDLVPTAGVRTTWGSRIFADHVPQHDAAVVARLRAAGAILFGKTTTPFENPEAVWFVVNGSYRMAQYGHHLARHRAIMDPVFVRQMDRVASCSAQELYAGIFQRTTLYRAVQAWFEEADIVAMPTLSRTALPIDQDFFGPITIDNAVVPNLRAAWYPYTMPFNLTGNPAVSLPVGLAGDGLPVAIQLVARPGEDARLLQVATALERARPWSHLRPQVPGLA